MLNSLTEDQRDFVDEMLLANKFMPALKFVMEAVPCRLREAGEAVYTRKQELGIDFGVEALARVTAFASLDKVTEAVCVIEASWDGDGWFIRLSAITRQPSLYHANFAEHGLCLIRGMDNQVERAVSLGKNWRKLLTPRFS